MLHKRNGTMIWIESYGIYDYNHGQNGIYVYIYIYMICGLLKYPYCLINHVVIHGTYDYKLNDGCNHICHVLS